MATVKLSDKQFEIFEYIQSFTQEHGFPPSVREIGQAVGLRSPSTVHAHLKTLDRAGYIMRDGHKMRAIRTAGADGNAAPAAGQWRNVPILGRVTAGSPILAVEDIEGYMPFDVGHSAGEFFALRVRGDSMINAGIYDGDTIVVRRQNSAEHREIVVALLGEEATVKRFYQQGDEYWLMPENDAYTPINAVGAQILGKVVGLYRQFANMPL